MNGFISNLYWTLDLIMIKLVFTCEEYESFVNKWQRLSPLIWVRFCFLNFLTLGFFLIQWLCLLSPIWARVLVSQFSKISYPWHMMKFLICHLQNHPILPLAINMSGWFSHSPVQPWCFSLLVFPLTHLTAPYLFVPFVFWVWPHRPLPSQFPIVVAPSTF